MISRETIDKIFETARIEEVIGDFVQLKKSGSNLKGLSPFSNERTPSFMVSPAKQIFKDFSSGKGGSVVSFLMEHEHYTYPEALRYLAQRYNIEIEETVQSEEAKKAQDEREGLYVLNDFALKYFEQQLWDSDEGRTIGLSYFTERGFSEESIREFKLGYSHESYEAFTQKALEKGFKLQALETSGLTKVDGARQTDRFRGRVMFPILSHTGRVLGFGGRTLKKDAKIAKYLNSPESPIYHKSKTLYGIHQAKTAIAREDACLLVEGYTDVISLHQAGVKNVVASSGTSLTEDQIQLIKRFTRNVHFLFDGDAAGLRASLRGIDMVLKQGMNVSVVLFPDGEDPDSFARANSSVELKQYLADELQDFLRFKAGLLLEDAGDSPLKKSRAARDMVESIAHIPDALERDAYVQECARILGMEERLLFSELAQVLQGRQREDDRQRKREEKREAQQTGLQKVSPEEADARLLVPAQFPLYEQERALCWLLLNYPEHPMPAELEEELEDEVEAEDPVSEESIAEYVLLELRTDELSFTHPTFNAFLLEYERAYNEAGHCPKPDFFLRHSNPDLVQLAADLSSEPYELHDWKKVKIHVTNREDQLARYTTEAVLRFKQKHIEKLIREAQGKVKETDTDLAATMEQIKELTTWRNQLSERLNQIV